MFDINVRCYKVISQTDMAVVKMLGKYILLEKETSESVKKVMFHFMRKTTPRSFELWLSIKGYL